MFHWTNTLSPSWDSVSSPVKEVDGLHKMTFTILFSCGGWMQMHIHFWGKPACFILSFSSLVLLSRPQNLSSMVSFPSVSLLLLVCSQFKRFLLSEWFIPLDLCCQKDRVQTYFCVAHASNQEVQLQRGQGYLQKELEVLSKSRREGEHCKINLG